MDIEDLPSPKSFEIEDLPNLGWIEMEEMGSENLYFKYLDENNKICFGFVKIR